MLGKKQDYQLKNSSTECIIYASDYCIFCKMAYKILQEKGVKYKKILVDDNHKMWEEIYRKTKKNTVPQIYINNIYIGGFIELNKAKISGNLDAIINNTTQ